jgi:hypothetical protein
MVTLLPGGSTVTVPLFGCLARGADMAAVVILASAAAVTFLAGTVLFVAGLMQPTGRRRRADEPTSAFGFLIRHAWKVLFPPSGTSYPRDQRMMAGGLMLMAIAALLAIGGRPRRGRRVRIWPGQ